MVMRNHMRFFALPPILRPEFVERREHLRLLREVCVQRNSLANGVLLTRMEFAQGTIAETGVVRKVDVKMLGEGLGVDMPNTGGPGRAVHKD